MEMLIATQFYDRWIKDIVYVMIISFYDTNKINGKKMANNI